MPTVNPIGSFYSPLTRAHEYLRQREAGYEAQSRTEESKYYPKGYWTSCSLAFMKPVLDKLGVSRFSDLRANYLLVMWDQYPTGRKKALFTVLAADSCPLCGDPDSMDHVALRCSAPALKEKRQELWSDVNRPYLFRQAPVKNTIPPGCTERVRTYLREYIKLAFSMDLAQNRYAGDEDKECLALWLARAQ
jgi:hypothetical protein